MTDLQANGPVRQAMRLQLLLRPSCMLCLEAEHALALASIDDFERIDIERDPALEARYGTRIPVIRVPASGAEIDWPFDAAQLASWRNVTSDISDQSVS